MSEKVFDFPLKTSHFWIWRLKHFFCRMIKDQIKDEDTVLGVYQCKEHSEVFITHTAQVKKEGR